MQLCREKQLAVVETEYNETADRSKILAEHLTNVKQEHGHTAQLVEHKEKEIETEIHLRQVPEPRMGTLTLTPNLTLAISPSHMYCLLHLLWRRIAPLSHPRVFHHLSPSSPILLL